MKTAKALVLGIGVILLLQLAGLAILVHRSNRQADEIASLKIAFDTEIKARESLQAQVDALKMPAAPAEKLTSEIDAVFGETTPLAPDIETKLNTLKQQYENVLVLHFFLAKCGKSTVQDFHTINSNLSQDMATLDAPGRLQYDIMTAAKGSYDTIYANVPCEGEQAAASEKSFREYIAQLTTRSNVPKQ